MSSWWQPSWRADPRGAAIADRHYNRQRPGHRQFVQHRWAGAWVNTTFRHETDRLASDLIRQAVAHTRDRWPAVPDLGMVTFVDPNKVRAKRTPGYCYERAGFRHVGYTDGGLWTWQMLPADMPEPAPCGPRQLTMELG